MSNDPGDKPPDKPPEKPLGTPPGEPYGRSPFAPPGEPPGRSPFAPPSASGANAPGADAATPVAPPPGPQTPYVEPPRESAVVGHHAPMDYQPAQFPRPAEESAAPYNPYGPPPGNAPHGPGPGFGPGYGGGAPPYSGPSPDAQHPYAAPGPQAYWPQADFRPPPPFPGVLWFSLLVVIGFFGQIVVGAGAVMMLLAIKRPNITAGNAQDVFNHLPVAAFMGILLIASLTWPAVALMTAKLKKMLNRDTFRIYWPGFSVSALAVVLGLALVPLALLLESLVARVVPRGDNVIVTVMARGPGVLALTLLGLTLVVAAPVGEELLFRGLGYRGIERRHGLGLGALAVSFIFAAVHMNATGFLALFMVSMALCWVTTKTGSLIPAILLHAAYNGVQFLMILASDITPEVAKKAAKSTDLGLPLWMFPAGLLIAGACLFAIGRLSENRTAGRTAGRTVD